MWVLGVCGYEMVIGKMPFGEGQSDPYLIAEEIANKDLSFPSWFSEDEKNENIISLITKLITKDPYIRFNGDFASLKIHPFFQGFEFVSCFILLF